MKETNTSDFWLPILQNTVFTDWVRDKYQVAHSAIVKDDEVEQFIGDVVEA